MKLIDFQILVSFDISFKQKWFYFRWPAPFFWLLLFQSKWWQRYVERNLKDGNLTGGAWQRWIPSVVDTKDGWVTFTGTKCVR